VAILVRVHREEKNMQGLVGARTVMKLNAVWMADPLQDVNLPVKLGLGSRGGKGVSTCPGCWVAGGFKIVTCTIRVAVDLAFGHENKHTLSSTLHLSFDMILTATFCSVKRRAHGGQHRS
jgi:hypothetical protein